MQSITIQNTSYPCRQTMGAFLRYKQETGKEATTIKGDLTELVTFLYCCVKSACKADNKEFNYSLTEFADLITMDDIAQWSEAILKENGQDANTTDEQKKSPSA